jgi:cell fate (sporulation/competence/biofilm development) regulator YlbF (YheA/YmcA/DUF963 family)
MMNKEKLERILLKLKDISREIDELHDFLAMTEALTTDKNTADRIRTFLERKEVWNKIENS